MFEVKSVAIDNNNFISSNGNSIIFKNQVSNLRIIDFLGSYTDIEYKPELDISNLQRGVYIIQFAFENKIHNYKFIKE